MPRDRTPAANEFKGPCCLSAAFSCASLSVSTFSVRYGQMDLAKLNRLRSKAQRLSRERFALIVFSQVMTIELRRRFELKEEELKRSSMTKLRQFITELEEEIAAIR